MNNSDYTWFFIIMTLFNSSLGISNTEKNTAQEEKQKVIEQKIDRILEILEDIYDE
jgi:hypothetical protein